MSALQKPQQINMQKFRHQIEIGTFWSASLKVRRGTVSKEMAEKQIQSLLDNMKLSPWLTQKLNELLELNKQRTE